MKVLRILVAMVVLALVGSASGQTLTTLWSFTGGADGSLPYAGLVQGGDGNFYGTTFQGGVSNRGTVFRIDSSGDLTNLYSFSGTPDGANPMAGLIQGVDSYLYGNTMSGGVSNKGTVFRISWAGVMTNIWSFTGDSDGASPRGGLVQGTDGFFYGTSAVGGNDSLNSGAGDGTVFRISPAGSLTNLHSFGGYPVEGANPFAGLVQGQDGNFYGTTPFGGASGDGTVFRISPSGDFSNLWSFSFTDGSQPVAALVRDNAGNLYGTTQVGGNGGGTVFRISPTSPLTTLWFCCSQPNCSDGASPYGGLVHGSDANFYGTTYFGGTDGTGTVFQISSTGSPTSLHSFDGSDGASPDAPLVQGTDGSFYGTTRNGGAYGRGTVFKISVPLNPAANQVSGIQPMGSDIAVTIPSCAGETYQLQFATDLVSGNWSNVVGVCVSNSIGAALTVTNFGGTTGPQGFYRFAITP